VIIKAVKSRGGVFIRGVEGLVVSFGGDVDFGSDFGSRLAERRVESRLVGSRVVI